MKAVDSTYARID